MHKYKYLYIYICKLFDKNIYSDGIILLYKTLNVETQK